MKTGIVTIPVIPVRSSHNERSEQVTQLLFGESFEVLQTLGEWLRIRSLYDDYEGWVDRKMAGEIIKQDEHILQDKVVFQQLVNHIFDEDNLPMMVPAGCRIPKPDEMGTFIMHNRLFQVGEGQPKCFDISLDMTETAMRFLNVPYLWGGKSAFGIDCSGFTQLVFRMHGMDIPRDSAQQVVLGDTICFRHDARPGDMAFFQNNKGKIVHVGIILDDQHIIHSSGKVRIDKFDHSGIYNEDLKKYTHELSVIKRIL